ncbi:MAG: polysaccharide biosynthesis tyrosine autokinase, partial [Acidimicrobiales bacterium]
PARKEQLRVTQADERQTLTAQLVDQRSQLSKLEAAANVERGGAQLLSPAKVPGRAFEPNIKRSGALGFAVGILLGLGLALLLDYLDNRVRGEEDLERISGHLPMVGLIPTLSGWRNRKAPHIATIEEPASSVAEAYRALRTSIQFLGLDRSLRTLQITSPVSGEGKTTTLVNLAVALARAGQRVVVVDCDLRRPRIHEFFGLDPEVGFTSVLVGDASLSSALQRVPDVSNLLVLTAGPIPPNPSELLSGRRTIEILSTLQADADVVLIDSPPVLPVSDAAALSTRVDGTLVVVNANTTTRKQLVRTLDLLRQVEAVVVGMVLNRAGGKRWGYDAYGYRYGYGYSSAAKDGPAHRSKKGSSKKAARRDEVVEPAAK